MHRYGAAVVSQGRRRKLLRTEAQGGGVADGAPLVA